MSSLSIWETLNSCVWVIRTSLLMTDLASHVSSGGRSSVAAAMICSQTSLLLSAFLPGVLGTSDRSAFHSASTLMRACKAKNESSWDVWQNLQEQGLSGPASRGWLSGREQARAIGENAWQQNDAPQCKTVYLLPKLLLVQCRKVNQPIQELLLLHHGQEKRASGLIPKNTCDRLAACTMKLSL